MSEQEVLERARRASVSVVVPDGRYEDLLRRRDRKRRNQRIAAGVVGIAVFVAAIVIVTSGGPAGRPQTPASSGSVEPPETPPSPGHAVVPEEPDPVTAWIGLPPEGAEPSTPREGELVLSIAFGHKPGDAGRFHMEVYADGRVIWWCYCVNRSSERSINGILEQRLTSDGLELVRSEVLSTGLFDHDLYLESAHGLFYGWIQILDEEGSVRLSWGVGAPEGVARVTPSAEQVSALVRLDARLEDLASWLPASAWVDEEARPYVPSSYQICYGTEEGFLGRDVVLDYLPRPAQDLLRPLDWFLESYQPARYWCSTVTTPEARGLAEIFDDAGLTREGGNEVIYQSDLRGVRIYFSPICPHGGSCW